MDKALTIRRYSNRRLYSVQDSRYITLADLCKRLLARQKFVVIDQATQADITIGIVLQALAARERAGKLQFSKHFLWRLMDSAYAEAAIAADVSGRSHHPLTQRPAQEVS